MMPRFRARSLRVLLLLARLLRAGGIPDAGWQALRYGSEGIGGRHGLVGRVQEVVRLGAQRGVEGVRVELLDLGVLVRLPAGQAAVDRVEGGDALFRDGARRAERLPH